MQYYEMTITVYLKKQMQRNGIAEYTSNLINYCMLNDTKLEELHKSNGFKGYVFNTFNPIESDGIYKSNKIYEFYIRSLDKDLLNRLEHQLESINNKELAVINTSIKVWNQRFIKEIYTYTPSVITLKEEEYKEIKKVKDMSSRNKYWIEGCGNKLLVDRIESNMIKKYNYFTNNNIAQATIIADIKLLNKYPIPIHYKKSLLLGNKFSISILNNQLAQDIAFISLATGLLEKGSALGCGFCKGVYDKEVIK